MPKENEPRPETEADESLVRGEESPAVLAETLALNRQNPGLGGDTVVPLTPAEEAAVNPAPLKKKNIMSISGKLFIMVMAILVGLIIAAGVLTFIVPQGSYQRIDGEIIAGSFVGGGRQGYPVWRWLTAPVEVLWSEDALNIVMVSVFLLVLSGAFNVMNRTGGIKAVVDRLVRRFAKRRGLLCCIVALVFMLFGSFFGMFEELVALMPVIIVLSLSMDLDTLTGMGMCMLAACFGFCAAVTNPFSVGVATGILGVPLMQGAWLRIALFVLTFGLVCGFLLLHIRKIVKNPSRSATYSADVIKKASLGGGETEKLPPVVFRSYMIFFAALLGLILLIAFVKPLSGLSVPILAAAFLIGGIACGWVITKKPLATLKQMGAGAASMLPAIVMILFASAVKHIMVKGGIMDTIMHSAIGYLSGKSPYVCILLIFGLVLFLQLFIGSASAKAMLIIPIIAPICAQVGISYNLAILAFILADGFTNVLFPTNAVLLVGLSMAEVGYGKWFRFTILLQLIVLALSVGILCFGVAIGY